jgi:hypothetical protein
MTSPPKRTASFSPRSSVRLAIAMDLGFFAAKWVELDHLAGADKQHLD